LDILLGKKVFWKWQWREGQLVDEENRSRVTLLMKRDMRKLNDAQTIDGIRQSLYVRQPVSDLLRNRISKREVVCCTAVTELFVLITARKVST